MPSIGKDLVLPIEQIRYCLAEGIRLDAAKAVVSTYSDADVNRFNAMVADYNSRCGSFRYHAGALEIARGSVELRRAELQAEGRSRFVSRGALEPDTTIRAIQQQLNELGYGAGAADGLMGSATRGAILAFQRDYQLDEDGVASNDILLKLQKPIAICNNLRRFDRSVAQGRCISAGPFLVNLFRQAQYALDRGAKPEKVYPLLSKEVGKAGFTIGPESVAEALTAAQAGSLYRCDQNDGQGVMYTNIAQAGIHCTLVSEHRYKM